MANPEQKLTVVKDGVAQSCQTYMTEHDATPITGKALKVNNNGVDCYIGLMPVDAYEKRFNTPLIAEIDGVKYYVQTEVIRYVLVNVPQLEHQSLKLTYFTYPTKEQVTVTTKNAGAYKAVEGTNYTVELIPDEDYVAGTVTPASGVANGNITFVVTEAVEDKKTITIKQTNGQTITVFVDGTGHTESFKVDKGSKFTATVTPAQGYRAGKLSVTSGTVNDNITVSATAAIAYSTLSISSNAITDIEVKYVAPDGSAKTSIVKANGSTVTFDAKPKSNVTVSTTAPDGFMFKAFKKITTSSQEVATNPYTFVIEGNTAIECVLMPAEYGIGFAVARRVVDKDDVQLSYKPIADSENWTGNDSMISDCVAFPEALIKGFSGTYNDGTVEFTVPDGCTKMLMMFTWDDGSQEHDRIWNITVINTKTGQQLWTGRNNAYEYTYSPTFRKITKGTVVGGLNAGESYTLKVSMNSDAYKARTYGINFMFGSKVEALATNVNMTASLAYYKVHIISSRVVVKLEWTSFPYGGTAANLDETTTTTIQAPAYAAYKVTAVKKNDIVFPLPFPSKELTGVIKGNTTIDADAYFFETSGDTSGSDSGDTSDNGSPD